MTAVLNEDCQNKLAWFFRHLAALELEVEQTRQTLAQLYDFEPYAAFSRIDTDGDKTLFTIDFYHFMMENDRKQFSIKDCQLLMQFYDLDGNNSLSYTEFLKFILPCDKEELREQVCQRKTYEVDAKAGKRLHPTVEDAMANYFEAEINCHLKLEMLKQSLHRCPGWNTLGGFNLIDSQKTGEITHFNLYGFVNLHGFDASDEELIAIIRRIEGRGNGKVDYDEFVQALDPIIVKLHDIHEVEDQGENMDKSKSVHSKNITPFLKKMPNNQPISAGNQLQQNLELYDQMQMIQGEPVYNANQSQMTPNRNALDHSPDALRNSMVDNTNQRAQPYGGKQNATAYKMRLEGMNIQDHTSPQKNDMNMSQGSMQSPYPRGPPLLENTNIHSGGGVPNFGASKQHGPLGQSDEKDLCQLFYEIIINEKELEAAKMTLAQCSDFNLMDAFSMVDAKSLGWASAVQVYGCLITNGVYVHKDDVYSFTRRYDRDNDSKLLYSDFCEAFTPKETYYAHNVQNRKPKYIHNKDVPKKNYFADQTRDTFFQCFKTHFLCDQKIELAKRKVSRSPSFNIHDAFSLVDTFRQGHLNRDDLLRIMNKNGLHPDEMDMTLLCARFDRKLQGIISYGEFMDEVLAKRSLLGEVFSMNLLRKVENAEESSAAAAAAAMKNAI